KIKRQKSPRVWVSLFMICLGLYLFSASSVGSTTAEQSKKFASPAWIALAIGLIISFNSATASIYTEILIKDECQFWFSQMYLYFWGSVLAGLAIPVQRVVDAHLSAWEAPKAKI